MHKPTFVPDQISALLGRVTSWLGLQRKISLTTRLVLLVLVALYLSTVIFFQTGPVNTWGTDTHILLDGGWRILNGQVPYRDFYLALGPLSYSTIAFGMLLTHASPQGIAVGNAVFTLFIAIWGWLLCRERMPFVPASIVTAWLILTASSPSPLGASAHVMSCAMIYNRQGYALLSLVLIECAFVNDRARFWGGVSSGAASILLLFLKLNFFGAAVLLVLSTIPFRRAEITRAWGVLTGSVVTFALFLVYLRSAIIQFVSDMLYAIHARIGGVSMSDSIKLGISNVEMLTALTLTLLALMLITSEGDWDRFAIRLLLVCGAMVIGSLVLRQTDYGEQGYQLAMLWTMILVIRLAMAYPNAKEKVAISAVVLMGIAGIFIRFAHDADALRTLLAYQTPSAKSRAARIPGMEYMGYYETDNLEILKQFRDESGATYVGYIDDGLYLLNKWSRPNESILTLGYNNPFAYILRRKPAHGGGPWLHERNNISYSHPLPASRVFGDAALIMVPRSPSSHQDSDLDLRAIYGSYLTEHFSFVAKSDWWSLYRRK